MNTLFAWYGKRNVIATIGIVVLLLVIGFSQRDAGEENIPASAESTPTPVSTMTARSYVTSGVATLTGTVSAVSEVEVLSERGGRVTSVTTDLGRPIAAGAVIATLENASERAAVLQAEGVYEAALAAAAQSTVGITEAENAVEAAENAARTTYQNAYTTVSSIVFNSIDQFYGNPQASLPGVRLDSLGNTDFLNTERVALQRILPEWQTRSITPIPSDALMSELAYARTQSERVLALVDLYIEVFNDTRSNPQFSDTERQALQATFTGHRSTLLGTLAAINSAESGLRSAREGRTRAGLAGDLGTNSAADAQVKQALGTLRAAQANLAKTIIRSPISGTINQLPVTVGALLSPSTLVAEVVNNQALEIVTFVSDVDFDLFTVGDMVRINDTASGMVATIAPTINPTTRKREVRISTTDTTIRAGDTVRVTPDSATSTGTEITDIRIPLNAVRFVGTDAFVLVVNDGILVRQDITLGPVTNNAVTVLTGLTPDTSFVTDARGKQPGQEVIIQE